MQFRIGSKVWDHGPWDDDDADRMVRECTFRERDILSRVDAAVTAAAAVRPSPDRWEELVRDYLWVPGQGVGLVWHEAPEMAVTAAKASGLRAMPSPHIEPPELTALVAKDFGPLCPLPDVAWLLQVEDLPRLHVRLLPGSARRPKTASGDPDCDLRFLRPHPNEPSDEFMMLVHALRRHRLARASASSARALNSSSGVDIPGGRVDDVPVDTEGVPAAEENEGTTPS